MLKNHRDTEISLKNFVPKNWIRWTHCVVLSIFFCIISYCICVRASQTIVHVYVWTSLRSVCIQSCVVSVYFGARIVVLADWLIDWYIKRTIYTYEQKRAYKHTQTHLYTQYQKKKRKRCEHKYVRTQNTYTESHHVCVLFRKRRIVHTHIHIYIGYCFVQCLKLVVSTTARYGC